MQYLWVVVLGAIWWISQYKPTYKAKVTPGQNPDKDILAEVKGEIAKANRIEAASWAEWLHVDPWTGLQDDVEQLARDNGGPANWSLNSQGTGLGWHTPCGPDANPNQYCPISELKTVRAASTVV
jgi:hypothetical protein